MRPRRFLRKLDQRVLPPIGRALAGFSVGTRRTRIVRVLAAVLAVAVVLLTVYVATRSPEGSARPEGPRVRVGVSAGVWIPEYAQQAADRLTAQVTAYESRPGGGVFALVSLTAYVTPQQLPDIVDGAPVLRVYTHVYVPGQRTDVRSFGTYQHLVGDMQDEGGRIALKAGDDARVRSAITGDSGDEQALRQMYAQQEATHRAEAAAYGSSGCKCVFALVVFGSPALLKAMAGGNSVRAVDPVAYNGPLSNVEFAAPRPEEKDQADAQDGQVIPGDSGV